MKKLFLLLAILAMSVTLNAAVSVLLTDGTTLKGKIISHDESLLVVEPNTFVKYQKKLQPAEVVYFVIDNEGRFESKDGKFVLVEQVDASSVQNEPTTSVVTADPAPTVQAANPNVAIGKAFKSTGSVCMAIGVPSLVTGSILTIIGYRNIGNFANADKYSKIATAGCVLMPFGAALTVVGIPLYINGQRIADININYTGNGAGVSVNF